MIPFRFLFHLLKTHTSFHAYFYRDHNDIKDDIMKKHEAKLGELENYCHNSSDEYDQKLIRAKKQINEREVYLARAQELLSSRYK